MSEKLCYNKGCGLKFNEQDDSEGACQHHPGAPVFHDAYKGWSCCNKKTTDFTEFLNIKGCTKGRHNPIKPVEPPKPKVDDSDLPLPEPAASKPKTSLTRPPVTQKMVRLPQTVGASLTPLLEKLRDVADIKKDDQEKTNGVPYGTPCKNSACKATYCGEQTNEETCNYHEGFPVFHEGMKYWSCCQRKTSDFNSFLEQEGCASGSHCWVKKETKDSAVACRYDWHQTGSQVIISVFAKASLPDKSFVHANPVKCKIHIVFGENQSIFDTEIVLGGIIDVAASSVEHLGAKVEIKLKKAEPVSWKNLAFVGPAGDTASRVTEDLDKVDLDDVEVLVNHEAVEDAKRKFFKQDDRG
ncbi:cysteine and histidine-rich domain-containing protein 1 [Galendromus occidentalis]|uniref:Cysteine and histidine-rich domain-containing protein 1 n=1 Tax=Galendromus occidentalis TaxID=34638 RepID=A0AAJ6VW15_9ACAR|nr:cysteine and histidine-rich domain-containing protein 1 [Galendromus occidentalis]